MCCDSRNSPSALTTLLPQSSEMSMLEGLMRRIGSLQKQRSSQKSPDHRRLRTHEINSQQLELQLLIDTINLSVWLQKLAPRNRKAPSRTESKKPSGLYRMRTSRRWSRVGFVRIRAPSTRAVQAACRKAWRVRRKQHGKSRPPSQLLMHRGTECSPRGRVLSRMFSASMENLKKSSKRFAPVARA